METNATANDSTAKSKPEQGPDVTITVDQNAKTVHRGSHLVSELKSEVGVDAALVLEQVLPDGFHLLDDNSRIAIKGKEVFFSHQRKGGSS
jgi:hypothetical protein